MPETKSYDWESRLGGTVQRWLDGNETLRLTAYNAAAGVRLRMSGRRFTTTGEISAFSHQLTPTTNRAATVFEVTPGQGWLLSVAIRVDAGSPLDGQCYVVAELGLGAGNQFVPLDVLVSDVITAAHRVAWPGTPLRGPLEGAGAVRAIAGTTPAAGAEISETVPTGARWELLAFYTAFSTSAAVANRNPRLIIDDGTNIYARSATATTIAASLTPSLSFAPGYGAPTSTASGEFQLSLPIGVRLSAGHRIRTATIAIQAADQYSGIEYLVREFLEGA